VAKLNILEESKHLPIMPFTPNCATQEHGCN